MSEMYWVKSVSKSPLDLKTLFQTACEDLPHDRSDSFGHPTSGGSVLPWMKNQAVTRRVPRECCLLVLNSDRKLAEHTKDFEQ
jgi:hypothetical protein